MSGAFIAIDWGTTNRRIYQIGADGAIVSTTRDDQGVIAMGGAGFTEAIEQVRAEFGDVRILCAGMIGSDRGWRQTRYVAVPAGIRDLADNILWVEPDRVGIVPGMSLSADGRADVMRGEEVQLLGAALDGKLPDDTLLCQPGTHSKWARIREGQIVDFTTAMTGELFALVRTHGLLANQMTGDVRDGPAFRDGVVDARTRDLASALFGARAAYLMEQRPAEDIASYVSGLLIGADCAARISVGDCVHVLADPHLGALYTAAIEALGGKSTILDSHTAFAAGIVAIERRIA